MQIKRVVANAAGKVSAAGLLVGATMASAMAAIPVEVDTAFTTIQTDGAAMVAKGWPVVTAVIGGLILIKLFKKVANRAS